MASNNASTRESRRRKILERGSDRLALISGRSPSIPSESHDKPVVDSLQPLNSHLHRQDPTPHLSGQFPGKTFPDGDDGENSSKVHTNDPIVDADGRGDNIEPPLCTPETSIQTSRTPASYYVNDNEKSSLAPSADQRSTTPAAGSMQFLEQLSSNRLVTPSQISSAIAATETSIQTSRTPASYVNNNEKSSLAPSADQRSTTPAAGGMQFLEQLSSNRFVTPSQISSAIAATESSRLFCSVIVAIFVVLSFLGFPLLGSNTIKSIICFRPLYLMLLTNLTLVLAQLLFNNQRGSNRIVGDSNVTSTKYDWAEQAANALEIGLLMKKAMNALVMDCSIYAIIVIAGFCIFH